MSPLPVSEREHSFYALRNLNMYLNPFYLIATRPTGVTGLGEFGHAVIPSPSFLITQTNRHLHHNLLSTMPRKETYSGPISAQAQQDLVSEGIENFELPKSVVMKIAKSSVRLSTYHSGTQVSLLSFVRNAIIYI